MSKKRVLDTTEPWKENGRQEGVRGMLKKGILDVKAHNAFFILFILTLCVSRVSFAVDIEGLKNAAENETVDEERGLIYKNIGDYYSGMGVYKEAGGFYAKAIALSRERFSMDERIKIAAFMSWAGLFREAIDELNLIISKEPENLQARMQIARVFSWDDKLDDALVLVDDILKTAPFNAEALVIKADILRRKADALSDVSVDVSRYRDSDDNSSDGYSFHYGFWRDRWRVNLNYRLVEARDALRANRARMLNVDGFYKSGDSGFGLGIGVAGLIRGRGKEIFLWNFKGNRPFLKGRAGAHVRKDVLLDTARLIETGVRVVGAGFYLSRDIAVKFPVVFSFDYNEYCDDNASRNMQFSAERDVHDLPRIKIGYRLKHLEFKKQRGSGYFDPSWFVSHGGFIALFLERDWFYMQAEPGFGWQSFRRFGDETKDVFGVAAAKIGYKRDNLLLEVNSEAGDYAAGGVAGFRYSKVGVTVIYRF